MAILGAIDRRSATRHLQHMSHDSGPANENKKLGEPGYLSPRGQRIETVLSLIGLAILWGSAAHWLNSRQWIGIGLTIGIASVFLVGAAVYRLIVYGRA